MLKNTKKVDTRLKMSMACNMSFNFFTLTTVIIKMFLLSGKKPLAKTCKIKKELLRKFHKPPESFLYPDKMTLCE